MVTGLCERPDAPNGATYDPAHINSVFDAKPLAIAHHKPYWVSDAFADHDDSPNYNPAAFYYSARDHNLAVNEPGPYEQRTGGMSRLREKRTWGK